MRGIILSIIAKGGKNSRYLISTKKGFCSIKVPNNQYELGYEYDIDDVLLDFNIQDNWLRSYYSWTNKKQRILKHLVEYKEKKWNITESGYWINEDDEVTYHPHILPDDREELNLIESDYYGSLLKTYQKYKDSIHRGFKNLNSSQAFAFNFFQPIIDENLYYLLDEDNLNDHFDAEFEKEIKEDKTQFDFFVSNGKQKASFEVKYTEDRFGTADYDSHKDKWNDVYRNKIEELLGTENLSATEFFEEYQVWRNILFTLDNNHITYFFYPRFRENDLTPRVTKILNKYRFLEPKVKIIYADDFIEKILSGTFSNKLKKHYKEFKKKYLEIDM